MDILDSSAFVSCNTSDVNKLMWMYSEKPTVFIKYSQYVPQECLSAVEIPAKVVEATQKVVEAPAKVVEITQKVVEVPAKVVEAPAKVVEAPAKVVEAPADLKAKTSKKQTVKKLTPMDIIVNLSENTSANADYINDALKQFITKQEFQKVFGIKKTSEVMKGLTENKWNKSLVLFLSFIFDATFIYLNKEVVYNIEATKIKVEI
ncbi:hypothetical protein [Flavobacterium sp.]|jgi:hypothetical protein|uniref:hypothetical protein n=1 Tax=Flavobacterium sp. TaxID=239 RepID=UPI0037BF6EF3